MIEISDVDIKDIDGNPVELKIASYPGETAVLTRSKELGVEFEKVTDTDILNKLPADATEAKQNLYVADLPTDILPLGEIEEKYNAIEQTEREYNILYNGQPLTLARYPNDDFISFNAYKQKNVVDDDIENDKCSFKIDAASLGYSTHGERYKNWVDASDMRLFGYLRNGYADTYLKASVNDAGLMTLSHYPASGIRGNDIQYGVESRFYVYNLLEEIDTPGEYYIEDGKIYLYPEGDINSAKIEYVNGYDENTTIQAESLESIIEISNSKNITIDGLELYGSAENGIQFGGTPSIKNSNITIKNCKVSSVSEVGITSGINRLLNSSIEDCEISETGSYGLYIYPTRSDNSGCEDILNPANIVVKNNHIHNFALYNRQQRPGIYTSGVGVTVSGNVIHNGPHLAIAGGGRNIVYENNYIYDVCKETDDASAIYFGGGWLADVEVKNNLIDMSATSGEGNMRLSVYVDLYGAGGNIHDNVLINGNVLFNGGHNNTLKNNLLIDCGYSYASWHDNEAADYSPHVTSLKRVLGMLPIRGTVEEGTAVYISEAAKAKYLEKYPFIEHLLDDTTEYPWGYMYEKPIYADVADNVLLYTGTNAPKSAIDEVVTAKQGGSLEKDLTANKISSGDYTVTCNGGFEINNEQIKQYMDGKFTTDLKNIGPKK